VANIKPDNDNHKWCVYAVYNTDRPNPGRKKGDSSKNILNDFPFTSTCILLDTSRKMRRLSTGLQFLLWVRRSPQIGVALVPILPSCAPCMTSGCALCLAHLLWWWSDSDSIVLTSWSLFLEYGNAPENTFRQH
jgi:hypothetical protein